MRSVHNIIIHRKSNELMVGHAAVGGGGGGEIMQSNCQVMQRKK